MDSFLDRFAWGRAAVAVECPSVVDIAAASLAE